MTRSTLNDNQILRAVMATQNEIVASAADLDATITLVCECALELTPAGSAVVGLADGEEMVYRSASPDGLEAEAGALSAVSVPITHRDTSVGVLKVFSPRTDVFDSGTVETLELLSSIVAAHITRAGNHEVVQRQSRQDLLTGLGNQRAYAEQLDADVSLAHRYEYPLSLCLLEVDGFEQMTDRYGHAAGDEALRRVARALKDLRGGDQSFRVGAYEFALLLPHTAADGAQALVTRLRDRLRRAFPNAPGISVSIGLVELGDEIPTELQSAAADALREVGRTRSAPAAV